jgi:hypothetical protein
MHETILKYLIEQIAQMLLVSEVGGQKSKATVIEVYNKKNDNIKSGLVPLPSETT